MATHIDTNNTHRYKYMETGLGNQLLKTFINS